MYQAECDRKRTYNGYTLHVGAVWMMNDFLAARRNEIVVQTGI